MSDFKAANKTKYDAGGSGDNIIADGYIKSVEKVWIDSYTLLNAALTTADTITIATLPANKKVTSVEVYLPAGFTPTTATINVGIVGNASLLISSASVTIDTLENRAVRMNNPTGFSYLTTATTNIILSLGVTALTAPTNGTIKTIVRYT